MQQIKADSFKDLMAFPLLLWSLQTTYNDAIISLPHKENAKVWWEMWHEMIGSLTLTCVADQWVSSPHQTLGVIRDLWYGKPYTFSWFLSCWIWPAFDLLSLGVTEWWRFVQLLADLGSQLYSQYPKYGLNIDEPSMHFWLCLQIYMVAKGLNLLIISQWESEYHLRNWCN